MSASPYKSPISIIRQRRRCVYRKSLLLQQKSPLAATPLLCYNRTIIHPTGGRTPMKIEMGESLFYSWLRHVKECQIVQTNWTTSAKWPLQHADKLEEMMQLQ